MKKRGQLLGMPFIMIFALIVGALTLAGGLYYIFKLLPMGEQISINKEINDFRATVKAYYYLEEGNSKRVKLQFPSKALNVCFYDKDKAWNVPETPGIGYPPDFKTKLSFYKTLFTANTERNMFFFPSKNFKDSAFNVPYLSFQSQTNPINPLCVKNGLYIRIVSMGDHVEVQAE